MCIRSQDRVYQRLEKIEKKPNSYETKIAILTSTLPHLVVFIWMKFHERKYYHSLARYIKHRQHKFHLNFHISCSSFSIFWGHAYVQLLLFIMYSKRANGSRSHKFRMACTTFKPSKIFALRDPDYYWWWWHESSRMHVHFTIMERILNHHLFSRTHIVFLIFFVGVTRSQKEEIVCEFMH